MEHISTFTNGLSKDLTKSFAKPSSYSDARNLILNSQGADSTAAVTTINGNVLVVNQEYVDRIGKGLSLSNEINARAVEQEKERNLQLVAKTG